MNWQTKVAGIGGILAGVAKIVLTAATGDMNPVDYGTGFAGILAGLGVLGIGTHLVSWLQAHANLIATLESLAADIKGSSPGLTAQKAAQGKPQS